MQCLPGLPAEARAAGARALLAREGDLTEAQRSEMTTAALSVLEDTRFAEVFGPGSRAEIALAGSSGRLPPDGRVERSPVGGPTYQQSCADQTAIQPLQRSEEHTSELQSLMRISYAVFCWKQN